LKNQLEEIKEIWSKTDFKTQRHKDKDALKLVELEEI